MKVFYSGAAPQAAATGPASGAVCADGRLRPAPGSDPSPLPGRSSGRDTQCSARIAVYDGAGIAPRVEDVSAAEVRDFVELLASRIYSLAREAGGSVPYTVVREVCENLLHANFREPVVSILEGGRTIRFSDQGPGIPNKERALLPGFTSATAEAKRFIRGVGSGLPIVQDYVTFNGGSLAIEDNLGSGTVVTVSCGIEPQTAVSLRAAWKSRTPSRGAEGSVVAASETPALWAAEGGDSALPASESIPVLSLRQKQVLALVAESGGAGPSVVAKGLLVGVSTAYRDLASLEGQGLVVSDDGGRRTVTEEGLRALESLMAG